MKKLFYTGLILLLGLVTCYGALSTSRDNTKVLKSVYNAKITEIRISTESLAAQTTADSARLNQIQTDTTTLQSNKYDKTGGRITGNIEIFDSAGTSPQVSFKGNPSIQEGIIKGYYIAGQKWVEVEDFMHVVQYIYCPVYSFDWWGINAIAWNSGYTFSVTGGDKYGIKYDNHPNVDGTYGVPDNTQINNYVYRSTDTANKLDKTNGGTVIGDVVFGTITAQNIYAVDIHVSSITVITQKSTATITDYLGSQNYDNFKLTSDENLNGYKLYGGSVYDSSIQAATTTANSRLNQVQTDTTTLKNMKNFTINTITPEGSSVTVNGISALNDDVKIKTNKKLILDDDNNNYNYIMYDDTSLIVQTQNNNYYRVRNRSGSDYFVIDELTGIIYFRAGGNANNFDITFTSANSHVPFYSEYNITAPNFSYSSPVYSTVTILIPFTSTDVTTASMIGQVVDIPYIGTDYIIKSWCAVANTAGTFTMLTTTAAFSNTPVYGNSIMQGSSPNLASTAASSGTVTGAGTITADRFMRATCQSATLADQVTVGIKVWIRK